MQYAKRAFPLLLAVLFFFLVLPSIASAAGDPVAGMTLYNTPFSGLSCGTSGCHGGFTGTNNPNKITNGANNPTIIQSAINGNTGGMGVFSGKFTATDLANIAAYIANPNVTAGSPAVSIAPASLAFGSQAINTSTTQSVMLTNSGTAALSVTGITAPSGYSQSNNCGSVAAGASCTINVTFTPTAVSSYGGSVTVTDNAAGSPHAVAVSGSGVGVAQASVAPAGLTFSQTVSTTSVAKAVTLTNGGSAALTVSSISVSANFTQTNNCGSSLAAGASCSVSVTFVAPATAGTYAGTLNIADNAAGNPHTASLSGTAIAATPVVSLSPLSLAFTSQAVGSASAAKIVTVSNTGTGPLSSVNIATSGDFAQTNTCGAQVNNGASCTISVTFTPTTTGARSGAVTINDSLGTQTVSLSGTGGTAPAAALSLSGNNIFASQVVGNTSAAQVVTLSNGGNAAANISSIAVGTTEFAQSNNCGTSLAAGATCSISITFKPSASGARTDTLTITDDAAGSPHKLSLSGTGVAATATIAVSPSSLDFSTPQTTVGQTSTPLSVTVSNIGNSPLSISGISASAGYVVTSNSCTATVAAGANCAFSVSFKPTAASGSSGTVGTVTINDNATASPHTVTLKGVAIAAAVTPPGTGTGYKVNEMSLTAAANGIVVGPDNNVWFTETAASKIGVMSPQGTLLNEYSTKTANSQPREIVVGPDKNLWFTESAGNKIGMITPAGVVTEYAVTAGSQPNGIAVSGNYIWFTEALGNKIGRIDTTGAITEYATGLTANAGLGGIAAASDGTLWFAETKIGKIGKLDPATGTVTEYALPTAGEDPTAIIMGPDGAFWFSMPTANKVGRIDTTGAVVEYPGLSTGSMPTGMTADATNNLCWFTESGTGKVASITASGGITEYSISGVSIQQPAGITVSPDGNIWVTEPSVNKMLVMSTVAPAGAAVGGPSGGVAGPTTNVGGGGGCTTGSGSDPGLPALLAAALIFIARRRCAAR